MKYLKSTVIFISIVILLFFVLKNGKNKAEEGNNTAVTPTQENLKKPSAGIFSQTRTNEEGSVTIAVTPQSFSEQEQILSFTIIMDTHTVELNEDVTQAAVLIDNKNVTYKPSSWEGDSGGGHHRQGILRFKNMSSLPSSFTLNISEIGGVPERSFTWQ